MKNQIKVLILGGGGREFQMASSFSNQGHEVYVAPGNDWMQRLPNVQIAPIPLKIENFSKIIDLVINLEIKLIIVGPEDPLCDGFTDYVTNDKNCIEANVRVIGPTKNAARLEGSKWWAKMFMQNAKIPTASARLFNADEIRDSLGYIKDHELPIVLKADGLCAGKGVSVCDTTEEAISEFKRMINGAFGNASAKVLVEDYLEGIEVSVFALIDDNGDYVILPEAKDYKQLLDGNNGPNTGGMGAISPVPFFDDILRNKVEEKILKPTITGMINLGIPYTGFLYMGLMIVKGEPYVIEYNCRMGDPETISVIDRIFDQFPELIIAASENRLKDFDLEPMDYTSIAVVLASEGYPENPIKGKEITINQNLFVHNFRNIVGAGVKMEGIKHFTNGGRVCTLVCRGGSLEFAYQKVYGMIEQINFEGMQYRSDIGADLSSELVSESEMP